MLLLWVIILYSYTIILLSLCIILFIYASFHWGKRDADVWSIVVGRWVVVTGRGFGDNWRTKCTILYYYSENNNGNSVRLFGWSSDEEVTVGGLVPVGIKLHNIVLILLYTRAFECIKYVCKSTILHRRRREIIIKLWKQPRDKIILCTSNVCVRHYNNNNKIFHQAYHPHFSFNNLFKIFWFIFKYTLELYFQLFWFLDII